MKTDDLRSALKLRGVFNNSTRRSLLTRLKRVEDNQSWQEFFDIYWRLLFSVARRAGLSESEAEDVVQETVLSVVKQIPTFSYKPEECSFKGWLLTVTQRRIADHYRKLSRSVPVELGIRDNRATPAAERVAQPGNGGLEEIWEEQWKMNLVQVALDRVKRKANPKEFEAFYLYVLREQPARKVAAAVGISIPRVYIAKHRVEALLKKERKHLEKAVL